MERCVRKMPRLHGFKSVSLVVVILNPHLFHGANLSKHTPAPSSPGLNSLCTPNALFFSLCLLWFAVSALS